MKETEKISESPPEVELAADHPGVADQAYRQRRAAIAAVGEAYESGQTIPDVTYTDEEQEVWRVVSSELREKHRKYACAEYLDSSERLDLPKDHVPQLEDVSTRLQKLSDFRIEPVPGLVPTRRFYGSLADRCFLSTQYIRHHSAPYYTPEPDIIHEVIGHANTLASPRMADLYYESGKASQRAESDAAMDFFSRVFWFTLEFGVLWEDGELRTYGSGILSSYGEIEEFRKAEIRDWDIGAMGPQEYDITQFQPLLFAAAHFDQMVEELGTFFRDFDNETHLRYGAPRAK
ncbi:MAG: phenylalanine 4-monooxygenase [Actinobacteria bacterium]|nr:phenylalanine 4-monooxygenase [Actinomycetota bacterium]